MVLIHIIVVSIPVICVGLSEAPGLTLVVVVVVLTSYLYCRLNEHTNILILYQQSICLAHFVRFSIGIQVHTWHDSRQKLPFDSFAVEILPILQHAHYCNIHSHAFELYFCPQGTTCMYAHVVHVRSGTPVLTHARIAWYPPVMYTWSWIENCNTILILPSQSYTYV